MYQGQLLVQVMRQKNCFGLFFHRNFLVSSPLKICIFFSLREFNILFSRRERLKETSRLRPDLEILKSDYMVFKRLPLISPLASKKTDSYFCMLQPSKSAHGESGLVYLEVPVRVLLDLEPGLAKNIGFPVCDFHEFTPIHWEIF